MSRTAIGVFDTEEAPSVVDELMNHGFRTEAISLLCHEGPPTSVERLEEAEARGGYGAFSAFEARLVGLHASMLNGIGSTILAGPIADRVEQSQSNEPEALYVALVQEGVPETTARAYSEEVRRGGALVAIRVPDEDLPGALDVLKRHHAQTARGERARAERAHLADVDRFESMGAAEQLGAEQIERAAGDLSMPVVEEELVVGKREVERGGIRARIRITEREAEGEIPLREEHIKVERHAADRPLSELEAEMQERTVEVRATGEEPVIEKRQRVVEEVVIHRDIEEHTQNVKGTVRREDVVIEPLAEHPAPEPTEHEEGFRKHFAETAEKRSSFEEYSPAYRYGYKLRHRAGEDQWSSVESKAKQEWESRNPDTWERFKSSIRHAWERARGK
ncbi:MAG TPA: YsnF/AvaK domain-containing protein [Polyangiaceae bacterium]|nr:YsnF/AvaK domain-containing protein [Polyangiaceae bacterium]